MKQKNYKKSFEILSFVLLSLSLIAIGIYLYKNSNIREKLSFASTISVYKSSVDQSKSSAKPLYSFVKFEPFARGFVTKSVELDDGRAIVGGKIGDYPALWSRDGKQLKYLPKERCFEGYLYDLNKEGDFTTTYQLYKDGFYVTSYLHNIDSDEVVELKSPDGFIPSSSSSLLENQESLEVKEYLETYLPNGIGTMMFEGLYDAVQGEMIPSSINNHGDIAGSVVQYIGNEDYLSKAILWFKSNNYRPKDISQTIVTQLGDPESEKTRIFFIDDDRNIWASAKIKGVSTVGYFECVGENKWKLRQSWNVDNQVVDLGVAARNDNYVVLMESHRRGDKVVYRKNNPFGRIVSRKPYSYVLSVRGVVRQHLGRDPRFIFIFNLDKNKELLGLYIDDYDYDFFTIDVEEKSIQMFSELFNAGLIKDLPEEIETISSLKPSAIDDDGNIYVWYYLGDPSNQQVGVGMLKRLRE